MELDFNNILAGQILEEFYRRVFKESIPRIKICLSIIEDKDLWFSPNENVNSIGNLILHLDGNARQWILTGLLKSEDKRNRQQEFVPNQNIEKKTLVFILDTLETDLRRALKDYKVNDLINSRPVQVFNESGTSILIHVIEHFSYHTGQITFLAKSLTNRPTNYYSDINLETND
ncbi:MAG: DinB family protein [Saprospiraceae bacterium]